MARRPEDVNPEYAEFSTDLKRAAWYGNRKFYFKFGRDEEDCGDTIYDREFIKPPELTIAEILCRIRVCASLGQARAILCALDKALLAGQKVSPSAADRFWGKLEGWKQRKVS